MMNLTVGIVAVYLVTSVWETLVHWRILHAGRSSRLLWKRLGGVFNLLRKAYFSHNTIHHRKTFRSSYFIQFDSMKGKRILDSKLAPRPHLRIQGDRYGLSISGFWENTVFAAVPVLFACMIFALLAPGFLWLGISIALIPMWLSKYVHPLLHEKDPSSRTASIVLRGIVKSRYFSYIQLYHFIHHRYGLYNFNLMPGGDFLFGVARSLVPTPRMTSGEYARVTSDITKPFS